MSSVVAIISRRALFALPATLLADGSCRAHNPGHVWAKWETQLPQKRGPALAHGLLVYFEDDERSTSLRKPITLILAEIARVARWDVLRIGKGAGVEDERVIRLAANEADRARASGYGYIIAAGIRQGGCLALLAARLPSVDAAIALAPCITPAFDLHDLAASPAGGKTKRIAAFFFDEEPRDQVEERRAMAVRRALQAAGVTFMLSDFPPDLQGPLAAKGGRFARKYRDCLLQFIQRADLPVGEVECSTSSCSLLGSLGRRRRDRHVPHSPGCLYSAEVHLFPDRFFRQPGNQARRGSCLARRRVPARRKPSTPLLQTFRSP